MAVVIIGQQKCVLAGCFKSLVPALLVIQLPKASAVQNGVIPRVNRDGEFSITQGVEVQGICQQFQIIVIVVQWGLKVGIQEAVDVFVQIDASRCPGSILEGTGQIVLRRVERVMADGVLLLV